MYGAGGLEGVFQEMLRQPRRERWGTTCELGVFSPGYFTCLWGAVPGERSLVPAFLHALGLMGRYSTQRRWLQLCKYTGIR